MTDKNKKDAYPPIDLWLIRYISKLKKYLKLTDWNITVDQTPCSSDCLGECQVVFGQHTAVIYLHKNFRKDTPEDLRATIVHELLHCHFGQITESAMSNLEPLEDDLLSKKLVKSTVNGIEYQTERVIDLVSEAIAPLLPLPNMPKPKTVKKKQAVKKSTKKIRKPGRK
jgi:hypothetical protein